MHMYLCMHVYMHVYLYICTMYMHMYIYIHVYAYIHVHMYISRIVYIYIHMRTYDMYVQVWPGRCFRLRTARSSARRLGHENVKHEYTPPNRILTWSNPDLLNLSCKSITAWHEYVAHVPLCRLRTRTEGDM